MDLTQLKDNMEGAMRSIRRLKPKAENNFTLNEISIISSRLDFLFRVIGMARAVIGSFSIANIMFVSVKEQTNQIGVQKSLGAKNYFILLQFLLESTSLCLIGDIIGLFLAWVLVVVGTSQIDFDVALSFKNILQGILISVSVGIISGLVPAYVAARLNPVDAIRSEQ